MREEDKIAAELVGGITEYFSKDEFYNDLRLHKENGWPLGRYHILQGLDWKPGWSRHSDDTFELKEDGWYYEGRRYSPKKFANKIAQNNQFPFRIFIIIDD